jgi:hypothetical protein
MKDKIIKILTSTTAKRFYWQTFNGLIGLTISAVLELNLAYAAVIVAVLNGITKEINTRYL